MLYLMLFSMLMVQDDQPQIREDLEVVYKQVKVRVTDRKGKPVRGLTSKDFKFLLNDKGFTPKLFQEVDYGVRSQVMVAGSDESPNAEVTTTSTSLAVSEEVNEIPKRNLSIVLDTGLTTAAGFRGLKEGVTSLVNSLRDDDNVRLYVMKSSLAPLTSFTTNKQEILASLDTLGWSPALWNSMENAQRRINAKVEEMENPSGGIRYEAGGDDIRNDPDGGRGGAPRGNLAERNSTAITNATSSKANAKRHMYQQLDGHLAEKRRAKQGHTRRVTNALYYVGNGLRHFDGDRSVFFFSSGGFLDGENVYLLEEVTEKLNWHSVAVHSFLLRDRKEMELNAVDASGRGVSISMLQDYDYNLRQLGMRPPEGSANQLYEDPALMDRGPQSVANETGGAFISAFSPQQIEARIPLLLETAAHHYLITYQPKNMKDHISIKPMDSSLEVFYGKARTQPPKWADMNKKERNQEFVDKLIYGVPDDQVQIGWQMKQFRRSDGVNIFPVLGLLGEQVPTDGFEIGLVALDDKDEILDERRTELKSGEKNMEFYDLLAAKEWPSRIRALIRNRTSGDVNLAEFRTPEKPDPKKPSLSSVFLIPNARHNVFAIHALTEEKIKLGRKKVFRKSLDPLIIDDSRMIPFSQGPFPEGKLIGMYLHIQNMRDDLENYQLISYLERGTHSSPWVIQIHDVTNETPSTVSVMGYLDTNHLKEGDYKLVMGLKDTRTGEETNFLTQPFSINKSSIF